MTAMIKPPVVCMVACICFFVFPYLSFVAQVLYGGGKSILAEMFE